MRRTRPGYPLNVDTYMNEINEDGTIVGRPMGYYEEYCALVDQGKAKKINSVYEFAVDKCRVCGLEGHTQVFKSPHLCIWCDYDLAEKAKQDAKAKKRSRVRMAELLSRRPRPRKRSRRVAASPKGSHNA